MNKQLLRFIITGLLLSLTGVILADTAVYARTRTEIKCGIVIVRAVNGVQLGNQDPHLFNIMDERRDIKPAGWEFDNPLAPSIAGSREATRWGLALNERIRKDMAPYWEIDLRSVSNETLGQFDILVLHAPGNILLSRHEKEVLRRYVDSGGLLWIDWMPGMRFNDFDFFVPLDFVNQTDLTLVNPINHPLLWNPHIISQRDAVFLGRTPNQILASMSSLNESGLWTTITGVPTKGANIACATYGSGHIVVTTNNVVSSINDYVGANNNSGVLCGSNYLAASLSGLELAYNMISWANAHQKSFKNPRSTNSNFMSAGAPLSETWSIPRGTDRQVAIYNGLVYVVTNGVLSAYDMIAGRDMDGDGDSDDGAQKGMVSSGPLQDTFGTIVSGTPVLNVSDLVWSIQLPTGESNFSSPTVADIMLPGYEKGALPLVLITGSSGKLYAFDVAPRNKLGLLSSLGLMLNTPDAPQVGGVSVATFSGIPPSPTYSEGIIFVTAPKGVYLVRAVPSGSGPVLDLVMSEPIGGGQAEPWCYPQDTAGELRFPLPSTEATVAYVSRSGGVTNDKVIVYGVNKHTGTRQPAGMRVLWFGVKGERIKSIGTDPSDPSGQTLIWSTEARTLNLKIHDQSYADDPLLGWVIRDAVGNVVPGFTLMPANGNSFTYNAPATSEYYIDYTIDWVKSKNMSPAIMRTFLNCPDKLSSGTSTVEPDQEVTGAVSVASNGLTYFVSQGQSGTAGSLYVINEGRLNQSQLVYRWQLPGTADGLYYQPLVGGQIEKSAGMLSVNPMNGDFPAVPIQELKFYKDTPPVVRGNKVYAFAYGVLNGVDVTVVLAFNSNPGAIDLRIGAPVTGINDSVIIRQIDLQKNDDPLNPDVRNGYTYMDKSQYELDRPKGILRIKNFMRVGLGNIDGAISLSLPVGIQFGGGPEQIIYPDETDSKWSPLLWYSVIPDFDITAPPTVAGDLLYIAGINKAGSQQTGAVYAFETDPKSTELVPVKSDVDGNKTIAAKQLPMDASSVHYFEVEGNPRGIVSSEGKLLINTNNAVRLFEKQSIMIADSGRLLEVDSGGYANLSIDSTLTAQTFQSANGSDDSPTAVKSDKLVQPTKAYQLSASELLVTDTGADHVLKMHRSGLVIRRISDFIVDDKHKPAGYKSGDSTELRSPRDATYWTDYVYQAQNPFAVNYPCEYWEHYLVADTGNNRIIEIVDRFEADPNTGSLIAPVYNSTRPYSGELFWAGLSALDNPLYKDKQYSYTAVKRLRTGSYTVNTVTLPTFSYLMTFGNVKPERASLSLDLPDATAPRESASGTGGILVITDDRATGKSYIRVINKIRLMRYVFTIDNSGNINGSYVPEELPIRDPICIDARESIMNNNSFDVLLTTADGVFELSMPKDPADTADYWDATLVLTNDDYTYGLRRYVDIGLTYNGNTDYFPIIGEGVPLRAASAKWMPNGNIMVVNNWSGLCRIETSLNGTTPPDDRYDFFGEVFELDRNAYRANLGTFHGWDNPNAITFTIKRPNGTFPIKQPQFADIQF